MIVRQLLTLVFAAICAGVPSTGATAAPAPQHDGWHDFDFNLGTWKTHVSRLTHPLAGSQEWVQYDGTSRVLPIWNGQASVLELDVSGAAGHIQGVGLRLYDAQARQWNLNWTHIAAGRLDAPLHGEFRGDRGDFFGEDTLDGRTILVRNSFTDIRPDSARFEQAFSGDYGRTWEVNWVMMFERVAGSSTPSSTATALRRLRNP